MISSRNGGIRTDDGWAINAFVGPTSASYIQRIDDQLTENGYDGTLLVMQSGGGVVSAEDAVREPIRTIDSGPVGGMIGCRFLAEQLGHRNVIAGDIGGTSFDIGLLIDGEPLTKPTNVINQYEYMMRTIDTESIGSGGGSIAFVDNDGDRLRVGPRSAGATPGPACYGQGGNEPTVTDADLVFRIPRWGRFPRRTDEPRFGSIGRSYRVYC